MRIEAKRIEDGMNSVAEAIVSLQAVRLGWKMGVRKLHLEGDLLIIVEAIMAGSISVCHLQKYINIIQKDFFCYEFKFTHQKRRQ